MLIGIALRTVAITQPLIDAHNIRQCYTAVCTRSILREPGFPLSSEVNWRGDQHLRLVLELPLDNYLAIGVNHLLHDLDASGKVVSLFFWSCSFLVLQHLWKRCLNARETFWANALFVCSPVSIFFAQAFQPEMLVQFLAFTMLWTFLRYLERGRLADFTWFSATACLVSLIKFPEIFHLLVLVFVLLFMKERWRAFIRPSHWISAAATVAVLVAWSRYTTPIIATYSVEWTPSHMLASYFGSVRERFDPSAYVRFSSYLVPFVMAVGGVPAIALGATVQFRERRWTWPTFWALSIAVYYLTWGFRVAQGHSYYQLPALGPCCCLFGVGMARLSSMKQPWISRYGTAAVAATTLIFAGLATAYLFRQDRTVHESALWIREHAAPNETVFYKAGHESTAVDFPHEAAFSYYADRAVWLDTSELTAAERTRAEQTSTWVVETYPPEETGLLEKIRRKLKRPVARTKPPWKSVAEDPAWSRVHQTAQIRIYRRSAAASAADPSAASTASPDSGAAGSARPGSSSIPSGR